MLRRIGWRNILEISKQAFTVYAREVSSQARGFTYKYPRAMGNCWKDLAIHFRWYFGNSIFRLYAVPIFSEKKLPNAGSPAKQKIILIKYRLAQYTCLLSVFIQIFSSNSIICDSMSFFSLFDLFFLNTCVYTCFWTGWFELNIFIFILTSKEFLTHINVLFYWLCRCL